MILFWREEGAEFAFELATIEEDSELAFYFAQSSLGFQGAISKRHVVVTEKKGGHRMLRIS